MDANTPVKMNTMLIFFIIFASACYSFLFAAVVPRDVSSSETICSDENLKSTNFSSHYTIPPAYFEFPNPDALFLADLQAFIQEETEQDESEFSSNYERQNYNVNLEHQNEETFRDTTCLFYRDPEIMDNIHLDDIFKHDMRSNTTFETDLKGPAQQIVEESEETITNTDISGSESDSEDGQESFKNLPSYKKLRNILLAKYIKETGYKNATIILWKHVDFKRIPKEYSELRETKNADRLLNYACKSQNPETEIIKYIHFKRLSEGEIKTLENNKCRYREKQECRMIVLKKYKEETGFENATRVDWKHVIIDDRIPEHFRKNIRDGKLCHLTSYFRNPEIMNNIRFESLSTKGFSNIDKAECKRILFQKYKNDSRDEQATKIKWNYAILDDIPEQFHGLIRRGKLCGSPNVFRDPKIMNNIRFEPYSLLKEKEDIEILGNVRNAKENSILTSVDPEQDTPSSTAIQTDSDLGIHKFVNENDLEQLSNLCESEFDFPKPGKNMNENSPSTISSDPKSSSNQSMSVLAVAEFATEPAATNATVLGKRKRKEKDSGELP